MKRIMMTSAALAVLVFLGYSTPASSITARLDQSDLVISWPGDVNCDTSIDILDALSILQFVVDLGVPGHCMRSADVTCDGIRDVVDALMLLRFSAAMSVPQTHGCPPIGPAEQLQIGDSVSAPDRAVVLEGIESAKQFSAANLGVTTEAFSAVIDADLDALAEKYSAISGNTISIAREQLKQSGGIAVQTAFFIYTEFSSVSSATIVHEYFHILQNQLVGLPGLIRTPDEETPHGGPRWLIEGSATYIQAIVDQVPPFTIHCADLPSTPSLSSMENWPGMKASPNSYLLGSIATEQLVSSSSLKSLALFWFMIGEGLSWQSAFEEAFGVTIDAFYVQFEAHRDTLCP